MKQIYFSTFRDGLEKPVEAMLRREGGVAVERMLPDAALYRSVREPSMPYMRRTYRLLFQMKPAAGPDEAIKRLLSTGGWLDRFPYEQTQGLRFRIVTAVGEQLVAANMRLVDRLERTICEQTGMRTQRERPDVELWVLCRPEAAYFLWRLGKREGKAQDRPRADVCAIAAFLLRPAAKNAAVLNCVGPSLPKALEGAGARAVTCLCPDAASAQAVLRGCGARVIEGNGGYTELQDASQNAVALYLPAHSGVSADALRATLHEARRLLSPDGLLCVIATLEQAGEAMRKARALRIAARYPTTLSGQRCAIWLMEPENEPQE